jgi:uncharacterized integral membrane protein
MKTIKLVILLILSLALVLVVAQNTAPTQAHFLWLSAQVPVILLLFLTAAGGFVAGLLVALLVKGDARSKQETGWTANIVLPGKGGTSSGNL